MSVEQIKELLSIPFTLPIVAVVMVFLWLIVKSVVDAIARSSEQGLRYKFLNKAVEKGALRPEDLQAILQPPRKPSIFDDDEEDEIEGRKSPAFVAGAVIDLGGKGEDSSTNEGALSASERIVLQRERSFRSGVTMLTLAGGLALGSYLINNVMLVFAAAIVGSIGIGQISYAMARREVIHRIREDVERSTPS